MFVQRAEASLLILSPWRDVGLARDCTSLWGLSWFGISISHIGQHRQSAGVGWDDSPALSPPTARLRALGNQNLSLGEARKALLRDSSLGVCKTAMSVLVPVVKVPVSEEPHG